MKSVTVYSSDYPWYQLTTMLINWYRMVGGKEQKGWEMTGHSDTAFKLVTLVLSF